MSSSKMIELLNKLKSGEMPSSSKLDLINEKRQEIPRGVNISKFQYEHGKNSRILFRLQMALPFNPETGEADEKFNPETKWRPPIAPYYAALALKSYAHGNKRLKDVLMTRASVAEWNTEKHEKYGDLNEKDMAVLRSYRNALVITAEAVGINDAGITGQEFNINYSVPVKRDLQSGQILGDVPAIVRIGSFMSAVAFAEINELDEAIKTKDPSRYKNNRPFINPSAIPAADDKQKKKWIGEILNSSIMGNVRPQNYLMAFEFKLNAEKTMITAERTPLPVFTALTEEDLKGRQIFLNYSKKYKDAIAAVLAKPALDRYWDFVECDICDSTVEEPTTRDAKAEASRSLAPVAPGHSFWNLDEGKLRFEWIEKLFEAISEFSSSDPQFESKMAIFVARQLRPLDDNLIGLLQDRIAEKLPLASRYVTDDILIRHKEACLAIYGDSFTDRLLERGLISDNSTTAVEETSTNQSTQTESVANIINEVLDAEDELDVDASADLPDVTQGLESDVAVEEIKV